MVLGETVETQVMNSVFDALELIKSGADEYNTDPLRVYKMYGNVMELLELPALVVTPMPSPRNHDCPNGLQRIDLKVSVTCVITPELGDNFTEEVPWWETLRHFANDVEKALMADVTRGGLAIDTIIDSVDIFEVAQGMPVAAADVAVTIPFRHLTSDPTQAQ